MLLIPCPWCGPRAESEFAYGGAMERVMPPPEGHGDTDAWFAFVYRRRNPAGAHRELWYHGFGCGRWLRVTRDTTSNEILDCEPAGRSEGET